LRQKGHIVENHCTHLLEHHLVAASEGFIIPVL